MMVDIDIEYFEKKLDELNKAKLSLTMLGTIINDIRGKEYLFEALNSIETIINNTNNIMEEHYNDEDE